MSQHLKLNQPEVIEALREARAGGASYAQLARVFDVSPRRIWQVLEPEEYWRSVIRGARRKLRALRAAKEVKAA